VDALRQLMICAAREFNAGRYFEAHEVLEDGLDAVPDELWDLVLGLIQVAVGYHKITRGLWNGAAQMLSRALDKVERFPPEAAGIDLDALRQRIRADIEQLRRGTFDAQKLQRQPPRLKVASAARACQGGCR
jgi:predicted metal-dependent hydrolase